MYEKMYECSKRTGADAVYCDINMVFKKHNDIYKAALHSASKSDFIKNYIATVWTVLWNTLVKTEIYRKNTLLLPEHLCYCEDFWLSVRFFYFANMVSYVDMPLYNYNRMNEESITYSLNHKTEKNEREVYLETIDFFSRIV
jgi:hypothetical protein